jgi:hypothetical protein
LTLIFPKRLSFSENLSLFFSVTLDLDLRIALFQRPHSVAMAEGSAELTIAAIFDAELVRQIAVTDL